MEYAMAEYPPPILAPVDEDNVLLRQYLQDRDAAAMEALFNRHVHAAYRLARRFLHRSADAEDAVQIAFLELLNSAAASDAERISSVRAWIMGFVVNVCRHKIRSDSRRVVREQSALEMAGFSGQHAVDDRAHAVLESIRQLEERYRLPVWLHFVEGLTFREIAASLGISEVNARKRSSRGIELLHLALNKGGESVALGTVPSVLAALILEQAPSSLVAGVHQIGAAAAAKTIGRGAKASSGAAKVTGVAFKAVAALVTLVVVAGGAHLATRNTKQLARVADAGDTRGSGDKADAALPSGDKAVLGAPDFSPSPQRPIGWRGDGTGRYPGATPPLEWGRWAKGLTHEIRYQNTRPENANASGARLELGIIKDWLVAGPFPVTDPEKDIEQVFITEDATLDPNAGDKAGSSVWKKVHVGIETQNNQAVNEGTCDKPNVDFVWAYGELDKQVGYGFTRLYSPTDGKLLMQMWVAGKALKVWLNGIPVKGNFRDPWRPNTEIALKAGWNTLLVKVACDKAVANVGNNPKQSQWHFAAYLRPKAPIEYDSHNLAWTTRMPGGSCAAPCVVGDKLFVTAGISDLLCLDRQSGKVLWLKSHTYFDAVSKTDKEAHPEIDSVIKPLVENLRQSDKDVVKLINNAIAPAGPRWEQQEAIVNIGRTRRAMASKIEGEFLKLDRKLYPRMQENDAGTANYTPSSDGQYIYATFGGGRDAGANLVCCYDLAGEIHWVRNLLLGAPEHGNHASPVLANGKLICTFGLSMIALDALTGKTIWEYKAPSRDLGWGMGCSPVALQIATSQVVVNHSIFSLADGKVLWQSAGNDGMFGGGACSTPVVAGDTVYFDLAAARLKIKPDGMLEAEKLWKSPGAGLGQLYHAGYISSPLLVKDVLYVVDEMGLIIAVDVKEGKELYRKRLDKYTNCNRGSWGICASPTLGGKNIFITENTGGVVIVEPGPQYKEVGFNYIESIDSEFVSQESFFASPVFDGDRIYLRGGANLYCIQGEAKH